MRKLLTFAVGVLLFSGIAAQANEIWNVNFVTGTSAGNETITGVMTTNDAGNSILSYSFDFSSLAGTCGYDCGFGPFQAFSTLGNGYTMIGNSSDGEGTASGDNSYLSNNAGTGATVLTIGGYTANTVANIDVQFEFQLTGLPGTLGLNDWTVSQFNLNHNPSQDQTDFNFLSASATLATPEPPSWTLMLGALLLMGGLFWAGRRQPLPVQG